MSTMIMPPDFNPATGVAKKCQWCISKHVEEVKVRDEETGEFVLVDHMYYTYCGEEGRKIYVDVPLPHGKLQKLAEKDGNTVGCYMCKEHKKKAKRGEF